MGASEKPRPAQTRSHVAAGGWYPPLPQARAVFVGAAISRPPYRHSTALSVGRDDPGAPNHLRNAPSSAPTRMSYSSSSLRTAMKASVGSWTLPRERIFFLPSFCFSSSFFFRVMSPP